MSETLRECDVLVFGSGSAGLAAALRTAAAGLSTVLAEKTGFLGGTTAMSGAGTWIPANHHAAAAGIADSPEDALAYVRAASPPGWQASEDALWQRFVLEAPRMLAFLERHSPLRFGLIAEGDPYPDLPGARPFGRMLTPEPLRLALIGDYAKRIRPSMLPQIFTYEEALTTELYHRPLRVSLRLAPRLLWRAITGSRARGAALVTGLLKGCLDHGCDLLLETRLVSLCQDDGRGRVTGAIVETQGQRRRIVARRGVVIATGGFEWDAARSARHFAGPVDFITSPRANAGDGHTAAEAAGAQLAHMDQANLNPAVPTVYEGRRQGMALFFHREPNAIVVNRDGCRFFDETMFNVGEVIDARDPLTGQPVHLPAWLVTDADFLKRVPLVNWFRRHDPSWIRRANTIEALGRAIGVPADALVRSVECFNAASRTGVDEAFGRTAKRAGARSVGLAPIRRPPFLAIPFNRSFVSTKGGPRTDANGAVLRPDGSVIEGLFCAGVAMANPFGTRGIGAGTTIGPNMTWGYVCGSHIAEAALRRT